MILFDPLAPGPRPGVHVDIPVLTAKDTEDLQQFCVKNNMDFVAASFVQASACFWQLLWALTDLLLTVDNLRHVSWLAELRGVNENCG